jgi:hypothetical protein
LIASSVESVTRFRVAGKLLVDEIAYVREDGVTQFHAQQSPAGSGAQAPFKSLKDIRRQIRLPPEQLQ